jgi:xanthine dehydrogenase accessory factor
VCDEREDWLTEERFPDASRRILAKMEDAVAKAELGSDAFVASVTPGHAFDERVVRTVLGLPDQPRYLGVIGSRRKAVLFRKELVEAGVAEDVAGAIHIPMGLNIGAADPGEIAVSVMAELVAVLRGVEAERTW